MVSSIAANCRSLLHELHSDWNPKARRNFNTVRSRSRRSWSPRLHATWSAGSGYTGPGCRGSLWPCARKRALQERSLLEGVRIQAVQLQARWPNFPADVVDTFRQWGRVLRLSHCSQLMLSLTAALPRTSTVSSGSSCACFFQPRALPQLSQTKTVHPSPKSQ